MSDEQSETSIYEQVWRSHGLGTPVEIPRTVTMGEVSVELSAEDRIKFREEIENTPAYLLETTLVRWLIHARTPDWWDVEEIDKQISLIDDYTGITLHHYEGVDKNVCVGDRVVMSSDEALELRKSGYEGVIHVDMKEYGKTHERT